jgi:hypothetical protein
MVALIRKEEMENLGVAEIDNSLGFHLLIGRESARGREWAIFHVQINWALLWIAS